MIRLKFWEPVYYRKCTDKASKVLIQPKRFVGLDWNIGDPMTFKVLHCDKDPHKRNVVFHRGVVVQCYLAVICYNSALAPKSDAYFPVVQVEGGANRKISH